MSGNLYVSNAGTLKNCGAYSIEEFHTDGARTTFTTSNLNKPLGLLIDAANNVYVVNSKANQIEKFSPSGTGTVFANTAEAPHFLALKAR